MNPWDNDPEVKAAPWDNDPVVAAPQAVFTRPMSEPAPGSRMTPQDEVTDASSIGRILDRFDQGAKAGWGAEPLGFSPESEKWLRDNKVFDDFQGGWFDTAKAINEAWMRPTAAVLDGLLRTVRAGVYSVAGGVGQAAFETGLAETPGRATRDLVTLGETLLTVGGAAPLGLKPGRGSSIAYPQPLAMDEASRLARAENLGFTIDAYHGSAAKLDYFDPELRGYTTGANSAKEAFFFTDNPALAGDYAKSAVSKKTFRFYDTSSVGEDIAEFDVYGREAINKLPLSERADAVLSHEKTVSKMKADAGFTAEPTVNEVKLRITNPLVVDQAGKEYREFSYADMVQKAKAEGHDALIIKNAVDPALEVDTPSTLYAVFSPQQIRQRASAFADGDAPLMTDLEPPPRAHAAAEGIPEPIRTVSDSAPLPPVTPSAATVDKAGNINLNRIAGGEDIKQIIRDTAESPNFNPKTRGPLTWEAIDDLAAETGLDAERLAKRAVGEAWNAEHIHAARQLFVQATDDVRTLAAKIKNGDNSDAALLKYAKAELKQVAAQEQVAGLADEAGRALGIFRRMAGQKAEGDVVANTIRDALGGRKNIEDRARRIADLNDPAAASRVMRESRDPTWKDRFLEVWYNVGLLSNPATHIANVVSNTSVQVYEALAARPTQGILGSLRAAIGRGDAEAVRMGDVFADWAGFIAGTREGVPAAWRAFRSERPSGTWAVGHDKPQMRAIGSFDEAGKWGGKQVRLAGRALMAEDELFRTIGARRQLWTEASVQARAEGNALFSESYFQRVADIVANPTPEMLDRAAKQGTKSVFQAPLGRSGGAVQMFANEHLVARLIVPFVRTPINIVKYAGENSPLGWAGKEVRDNLRGLHGAAKQDDQIARLFVGSMISTALVSYAADGTITGGGPTDPVERAIWMLQNKPYHVRIGGYEYDYKRLTGPLGILLGVTADTKEVVKHATQGEADKIAALVGASIVKNLVQQTWMQGPADLVKAISDPDRYGEKWVERMAASMVTPAIGAQVARIDDPYLRDARSMIDAIKARTPGFSEEVAPQRDIFGQMVPADTPLVHAARQQSDPVVQAFLRLGLFPSRPDRKLGGVELTPEQYDRLQFYTGQAMRQMTDVVVKTQGFHAMPEFAQKEMLTRAVDTARRMGRAKTQMGDPDLLRKMMQEQQKRFAK